jgi:hypothetical protein
MVVTVKMIKNLAFRAGMVANAILALIAVIMILGAEADVLTKLILLGILAATASLVLADRDRRIPFVLLIILAALLVVSLIQVQYPLLLFVGYGLLIPAALLPPALVAWFRLDRLIAVAMTTGVALGLIVFVNGQVLYTWADGALQFVFEPAVRDMNLVTCGADAGCRVVWPIIYGALFFFIVLTSFAYNTLLERR